MGGNALSIKTRRVNFKEFIQIQDQVSEALVFNLGYAQARFLPYIFNKESFGDLDLILPKPKLPYLEDFLTDYLGSREVVHNGDIVSFEYREFQIDLIHTPFQNLDIAQTYFSYNDLGMLMGMLAKRVGCKYGSDGLYLVRYNHNKSRKWEIFLSKDSEEIFWFLGLNYSRFLKGFESLEDVFEFVYCSHLFDSDAFLNEEGWNHRRRTRNKKRPTWQAFKSYLKKHPKKLNPKPKDPIDYCKDYFPPTYIDERLERIREEDNRRQIVKERFNGKLVEEVTGLRGKDLSRFIAEFKKQFEDFENFILNQDKKVIKDYIKKFAQNRSQTV
jgi:hypothetical protein